MKILKETQKDIKIIVLVRDIIEVLGSFIRWSHNRNDTFINKYNVKTIEEKCDKLMQEDYIIKNNLKAVTYLLLPENKNLCHWVEYNDLVEHPKRTIEGIYDYLKISKFKHHYVNLDQFEVNGMKYDDKIVGEGLHTIETNSINSNNYNEFKENVSDILPKSIIEKYKQCNFWKG